MSEKIITPKMLEYCIAHGISISTDHGRIIAGYQFVKLDGLGDVVAQYSYVQIEKAAG